MLGKDVANMVDAMTDLQFFNFVFFGVMLSASFVNFICIIFYYLRYLQTRYIKYYKLTTRSVERWAYTITIILFGCIGNLIAYLIRIR